MEIVLLSDFNKFNKTRLQHPPDLKSPCRFFTNPSWLFIEPDKKLRRLTSRNKIWNDKLTFSPVVSSIGREDVIHFSNKSE